MKSILPPSIAAILAFGGEASQGAALSAIIDTHIHIYDPTRPQGVPWPPKTDRLLYRTVMPSDHARIARPAGVTGAIVVESSDWPEDNQWALDQIRGLPDYLGLIGNLRLGVPGFPAYLERFSRDRKFRGIRIRTQTLSRSRLTPEILRDLKDLAARKLKAEFIVMSGPENTWADIQAVAERVPDLTILLDHLASARVDGKAPDAAWASGIRALAAKPTIYCKVSGLFNQSTQQPAPVRLDYYRPILDLLWDAFGENRLIYGSNWPVSDMGGDFAAQQNLVNAYFQAKGVGVLEKVMAGNAVEFYGIDGGLTGTLVRMRNFSGRRSPSFVPMEWGFDALGREGIPRWLPMPCVRAH